MVVELSGVPNPDLVLDSNGPCSILGLSTPEPVLQLGSYVFKGRYEDTPGTCLFFRENGKELRYECASTKKLSMSRVVLKKKQTSSAANGELAEKDGT